MNILQNTKLSYFRIGKYTDNIKGTSNYYDYPRPFFNIAFVFKGNGTFTAKDISDIKAYPNDIIIVPASSQYASSWIGFPDYCFITFHFVFENNSTLFDVKNIPLQKIPSTSEIGKKFQYAYESFEESTEKQFKAISCFYDVLSEIFPKLEMSDFKYNNTSVKLATDYIMQNYKSAISIDELAQVSHLSPSRFFAVFKKEMGMSPIEYKNQISVRNAEKLLLTKDCSIEEISSALGFNSSDYFRRIFKAYTGKTPREYRKFMLNT